MLCVSTGRFNQPVSARMLCSKKLLAFIVFFLNYRIAPLCGIIVTIYAGFFLNSLIVDQAVHYWYGVRYDMTSWCPIGNINCTGDNFWATPNTRKGDVFAVYFCVIFTEVLIVAFVAFMHIFFTESYESFSATYDEIHDQ